MKKVRRKMLTCIPNGGTIASVVSNKKVVAKEPKVIMRATPEDLALMEKLKKKLGITSTFVLRQAIRKLADLEGVR